MFINQDVNLWLIATERQLVNVFTNMDLQGNTGKKYTISYRFSEKPERPREIEGWPKSRAELLDRLHDAGEVVDSGQIRCHICREVGHAARFCTQERAETNTQPAISCSNCAAEGHRLRDCAFKFLSLTLFLLSALGLSCFPTCLLPKSFERIS